jgi:hypothetical protein
MKPWYKDLKVGDLVTFSEEPRGNVYKVTSLEGNRVVINKPALLPALFTEEIKWTYNAKSWDNYFVKMARVQFAYNGLQWAVRRAKL